MSSNDRAGGRWFLHPHDLFVCVYLALSLAMILVFPGRIEHGPLIGALHLAGILAIVGARWYGLDRSRLGMFLLAIYPIILFSFFYIEQEFLNDVFFPDRYFDEEIIAIEEAIFRSLPSNQFHEWVPIKAVGEYLHFCYFIYYLITPGLLVAVWAGSGRAAFERSLAAVCLVFFCSFAFFIAMPVTGPYHVWPVGPPEGYGYVMPKVARFFIDRGSSIGTAFPSSHVSVSVAAWMMVSRYATLPWKIAYAAVVPALALGAVYGGFHYAIDIVAGAILGIVVASVGHALALKVSRKVEPDYQAGSRAEMIERGQIS